MQNKIDFELKCDKMDAVTSLKFTFCFILTINQAVNSNAVTAKSDIDPRIAGGHAINIQSAPWQVSVRLLALEKEMYGLGHICSGSVISQRAVLTAAHCVLNKSVQPVTLRKANEYTLVMGSAYLTTASNYTLQYDVLRITINSNFNLETAVNDIALFFINGYIPLNWPTVSVVSLNTAAESPGTICTVTGWGSPGLNSLSNVLKQALVPIVDLDTCYTNYGNLSSGVLCAGYMETGAIDACQADSGGPLVCNGFLVGIVSWRYSCAQPGYPSIYTNVSYYYDWIVNNNTSFNDSCHGHNHSNKKRAFLSYLIALGMLALRKVFNKY